MDSGEIAVFAGVAGIINLTISYIFSRISSEKIERLKTQLSADKDKSHFKFTKYYEMQVGAFTELGKLEAELNMKLLFFVSGWEPYFEKLFDSATPTTKQFDEDWEKIESIHSELSIRYLAIKIYLTDDMDKIYIQIMIFYGEVFKKIKDVSNLNKAMQQNPEEVSRDEINELNYLLWPGIETEMKTDLPVLKYGLKLAIQKFIDQEPVAEKG